MQPALGLTPRSNHTSFLIHSVTLHLPLSCSGKHGQRRGEDESGGSEVWEGYEDQKEAQLVQQMTPGFLVDELDKGQVKCSILGQERGVTLRTFGPKEEKSVVTLLEDI